MSVRQFLNVLSFTYKERVRTRAFLVTTMLMFVIMIAVSAGPAMLSAFSHHAPGKIVLINEARQFSVSSASLRTQMGSGYIWQSDHVSNLPILRNELKRGQNNLAGIVVIQPQVSAAPPTVTTIVRNANTAFVGPLQTYLQSLYSLAAMRRQGMTAAQDALVMAKVPMRLVQVVPTHQNRFSPVYFLEMLLYMFVLLYGSMAMMSVAAEKSSRVQELLIANVKSVTLLYGKLVGISLVGLTQYPLILIAAYIGSHLVPGQSVAAHALFYGLTPGLLALFVVFFLLGFFLFATLYAAVGSLVSRVEDVSQASSPITMIFILSFMAAMFALDTPNSAWVTVLSFIPNFIPMVMFAREGMTTVPPLQLAIAIVILFCSVLLSGYISARVYRIGVTLYGKRPTLREVWALLRAQ